MQNGIVFRLLRAVKTVNTDKLKRLIATDSAALEHYNAGRFTACAERVNAIAEPLPRFCPLSRLGVLELHAPTPHFGASLLAKLDAAAKTNPIIAEIVRFMGPGNQGSYPDFGLRAIRDELIKPIDMGGVGATAFEAGPILAAGVQPDHTSHVDIYQLKEREQWQPIFAAS